jgi:hypothetical protein
LIDFISKEPTNDDHKTGHKFPYTACEILASDNSQILERIFEEKFVDEDKSNHNEDVEVENSFKNEKKDSFHEEELKHEVHQSEEPHAKKEQAKLSQNTETPIAETSTQATLTNPQEITANPVNEEKKQVEPTKQEEVKVTISENIPEEITGVAKENDDENSAESNNTQKDETNQIDKNFFENEIKEDNSNNVSKNIRKTIKYEMLDYFFSFLKNDFELNFVLCGYFLKVFNHLQTNKGSIVIYRIILAPKVHFYNEH